MNIRKHASTKYENIARKIRGNTKMDFNYKKAWQEVARPEFYKLPAIVRNIVAEIAEKYENIGQLKNLDMPRIDSVWEKMEKLSDYTLSKSAMVVYYFGHWFNGKHAISEKYRKAGAAWKYANIADSILRARFNISRDGSRGYGLAIVNGELRCTYSSVHTWTWECVGYAIKKDIEYARKTADEIQKIGEEKHLAIVEKCKVPTVFSDVVTRFPILPGDNDLTEKQLNAKISKMEKTFRAENSLKVWKEQKSLARKKLDAEIWILKAGLDSDNLIYYKHTGRFSFGWRKSVYSNSEKIKEKLVGFPWPIDVV
jgi:hypothetical protein